jgi:hypothetical protein
LLIIMLGLGLLVGCLTRFMGGLVVKVSFAVAIRWVVCLCRGRDSELYALIRRDKALIIGTNG